MTKLNKNTQTSRAAKFDYSSFKKIDGKHPLQKDCPESVVLYKARKRKGGKVAAFNFQLAKDMGLIPKDHPEVLTKDLEKHILETFSIVIINEYDEINNIKFPQDEILPHKYMATRYLQLQHPTKKGKTSGDGRSVWNGVVRHKGRTWDISSCGTGATKLSPATHLKNKYFQTGDPSISYGCGYSELDEGLASYVFSEVFNQNEIKTERVLALIEFKGGLSINVRAHENLIRPSHMFCYLKQNRLGPLRSIVDYYIDRQVKNGIWKDCPKTRDARYKFLLDRLTYNFAEMAATFEDEYIFCWLDWDGDNILMDGSIIDYGSVRQFGLFHHEYRYDDVQRYSTTILEQKQKAKYTIQTFAQLVDYIITGNKKSIEKFSNHKSLKEFDKAFENYKNWNILYKIGFKESHRQYLYKHYMKDVVKFRKDYSYFERAKSKEGITKVADGINWSAIYCMRDIMRELPQLILGNGSEISKNDFIEVIKSTYAKKEDLAENSYRDKKIKSFQKNYLKLFKVLCNKFNLELEDLLLEVSMRSSIINRYDRVTGDSITTIVDKIMSKKSTLTPEDIYKFVIDFSKYQNLDPTSKKEKSIQNDQTEQSKLLKGMLKIVRDFREGL